MHHIHLPTVATYNTQCGLFMDDDDNDVMTQQQTSRIQVKKGPNGVDYEYEYVYYYYDDDEKEVKTTVPPLPSSSAAPVTTTTTTASSTSTTEQSASLDKEPSRPSGKNRYASLDRNGSTHKPILGNGEQNEIPLPSLSAAALSRGKGRQVIPVNEEVIEERLPANTRFPPRHLANGPTVSVISTVEETTKRISVKRPSLELVDSHSFNRGDKNKGSRVVIENEFNRNADKSVIPLPSASPATSVSDGSSNELSTASPTPTVSIVTAVSATSDAEATTPANEWTEYTTQIMDRVALDLYAHLVNENSIADATTTPDSLSEAVTTDASTIISTTNIDGDYTTTFAAPTTTTTTTTTETTTTTTTTEAPAPARKSPYGGRNRFRLRPTSSSTATPEATVVERKEPAIESSKPKSMY